MNEMVLQPFVNYDSIYETTAFRPRLPDLNWLEYLLHNAYLLASPKQ